MMMVINIHTFKARNAYRVGNTDFYWKYRFWYILVHRVCVCLLSLLSSHLLLLLSALSLLCIALLLFFYRATTDLPYILFHICWRETFVNVHFVVSIIISTISQNNLIRNYSQFLPATHPPSPAEDEFADDFFFEFETFFCAFAEKLGGGYTLPFREIFLFANQ